MKPLPPIVQLAEMFEVREDGTLGYRIARFPYFKPGDVAGTQHKGGYVYVRIDGVRYAAHRIIFALANGREPTLPIDHINGDPSDNRPCNLREATPGQNAKNRRPAKRPLAKGVSIYKRTGKYQAQITTSGRSRHLGYFDDEEAAELAYAVASERLHGEFGRTQEAAKETVAIQKNRYANRAKVDGIDYSFKELAEMLGLKLNTVWARYKKLEQQGPVTMHDLRTTGHARLNTRNTTNV